MRYSSALVLSTLAIGQAAAANHHNRHASFHARRQQAEAKRSAANDVNWDGVAYDLKDVDWDKVNWSSVFASPTPTPAAQATPSSTAQPKTEAAPTSSAEPIVKAQEVKTSAAPSSTQAATSSAAAATTTQSSGGSLVGDLIGDIGDVVSDLLEGVQDICNAVGIKSIGVNDKSNNGGIWVGDDSNWKAEFTNDGTEDAVLVCWKANGFDGMSLNVHQPAISVGLKPGQKTVISFAENVPSACAPAFKHTKLAYFGGLDTTWWEVTFGQYGAFDVSRNVNMFTGANISSVGSKCTSSMTQCVFTCNEVNGKTPASCGEPGSYDLSKDCKAENGGGQGYDSVMQGVGGGCAMGSDKEFVKVSFS
ncbi:hypothetical protein E8E13_006905 [Curvularia kusanoi]|uniref:Uncharacterized protein n=1 Tax=Curvularia kusanoi TaxID=90978 RepID=A0A9P4W4K3_CURKU|nr:hypothetical protein E8E13_006905 [Curvularia kusanoi]